MWSRVCVGDVFLQLNIHDIARLLLFSDYVWDRSRGMPTCTLGRIKLRKIFSKCTHMIALFGAGFFTGGEPATYLTYEVLTCIFLM